MIEGEAEMRRMPGWVARDDRQDVVLNGMAVRADGCEIPVEVRNLSRDGCSVFSEETIGIGEVIRLNAPPLDNVVGTIRWSLLGRAGLRFVTPLG